MIQNSKMIATMDILSSRKSKWGKSFSEELGVDGG
jgi:hypothetical protein